MAYEEQAMTKVQMAKLETLDPDSQEWREKLEHIQGAVKHHMYEEEGTWFSELQQSVPATERGRLTQRFLEEFRRFGGQAGNDNSFAPAQMAAQGLPQNAPQQSQGSTSLSGAADY
jgi:hypothetical protein